MTRIGNKLYVCQIKTAEEPHPPHKPLPTHPSRFKLRVPSRCHSHKPTAYYPCCYRRPTPCPSYCLYPMPLLLCTLTTLLHPGPSRSPCGWRDSTLSRSMYVCCCLGAVVSGLLSRILTQLLKRAGRHYGKSPAYEDSCSRARKISGNEALRYYLRIATLEAVERWAMGLGSHGTVLKGEHAQGGDSHSTHVHR
jgi:hypothetical protein